MMTNAYLDKFYTTKIEIRYAYVLMRNSECKNLAVLLIITDNKK